MHFHSLTFIGLFKELICAPSILRYAEYQEYQRTDWKKQVAYDEALAVQDISSADKVNVLPYIVTQHARHAGSKHEEAVDENRLCTAPFEVIHG